MAEEELEEDEEKEEVRQGVKQRERGVKIEELQTKGGWRDLGREGRGGGEGGRRRRKGGGGKGIYIIGTSV